MELGLDPQRSYGSFAEMAKAEAKRPDGIEAVAIVTPNNVHYPAAKAFLEAGIHVICDKPLTSNLADAKKLAALVEKSGKVFVLTHNYTAYPMVRQARDMVARGQLGDIRVVRLQEPQDLRHRLRPAVLDRGDDRDPALEQHRSACEDIRLVPCHVDPQQTEASEVDDSFVDQRIERRRLD